MFKTLSYLERKSKHYTIRTILAYIYIYITVKKKTHAIAKNLVDVKNKNILHSATKNAKYKIKI